MEFAEKIFHLAAAFSFSVTSWIRSAARNKAVGGVADSRHLVGLAVDVVLDEGQEKAAFLKAAGSLGLQVIDEGDHLHVQEPRARPL